MKARCWLFLSAQSAVPIAAGGYALLLPNQGVDGHRETLEVRILIPRSCPCGRCSAEEPVFPRTATQDLISNHLSPLTKSHLYLRRKQDSLNPCRPEHLIEINRPPSINLDLNHAIGLRRVRRQCNRLGDTCPSTSCVVQCSPSQGSINQQSLSALLCL